MLGCLFMWSLHTYMFKLFTLTLLMCNILFTILYLYYTPLIIILFYKFILINCGCMFWWVFFCNGPFWLAYHQKLYKIPHSPKKTITLFYTSLNKFTWFYICVLHLYLHECKWILNVRGAPSQALQIICEMQSQRTSQKRAIKKILFSNCKTRFFFSFWLFLFSYLITFLMLIHFKQFKML